LALFRFRAYQILSAPYHIASLPVMAGRLGLALVEMQIYVLKQHVANISHYRFPSV